MPSPARTGEAPGQPFGNRDNPFTGLTFPHYPLKHAAAAVERWAHARNGSPRLERDVSDTIEMSSSKSAKWTQPGPPVEHWLPFVAQAGVTCLWLAMFVHHFSFPVDLASQEFGISVLAGTLVWPLWGGARLAARPSAWWAWVLGGLIMASQVVLFLTFLPYLKDMP